MKKTHLVIHHSLTEDGDTLSWPVIRRVHQERGWPDIAYNLGIEWVRREATTGSFECLLGRPLDAQAAGAWQQNMNRIGVHVLFVGNYDKEPPRDEMILFAAKHLAPICGLFKIEPTEEFIIPHRQVAPYKSCPGSKFPMQRLIQDIQRLS